MPHPQIRDTCSSDDAQASRSRLQSDKESLFDSNGIETLRSPHLDHMALKPDKKLGDLHHPSSGPNALNFKIEMLRKLFVTYQMAQKDFEACPLKTRARTKSAKFLRDTTENCLSYLTARQTPLQGGEALDINLELLGGEGIVEEMKLTLQKAIEVAEEGSGGKKRRFDEDWASTPSMPAAMRHSTVRRPLTHGDPVPRGTQSARDPGAGFFHDRVAKQQSLQVAQRGQHIAQHERLPRQLHPASASKGTRRVFPMPTSGHGKQATQRRSGHIDSYRPKYNQRLTLIRERVVFRKHSPAPVLPSSSG